MRNRGLLVLPALILLAACAAPKPAVEYSLAAPGHQIVIPADIKAELDQVRDAYGSLKSMRIVGCSRDSDSGFKEQHRFTITFMAPNRYRLATDPAGTNGEFDCIGCDGEKTYTYFSQDHTYQISPVPRHQKVPLARSEGYGPGPMFITPIGMALSSDPEADLFRYALTVKKAADVRIGDRSYPAIAIDGLTLVIDPKTHLLVRVMLNYANSWGVTYDFAQTTLNPPMDAGQFAFVPPAGSKELIPPPPPDYTPKMAGKPAPAFKLRALDGSTVDSADFKGSVVVLDIGGIHCPPCVRSLAEMDRLYLSGRDNGVKVFVINIDEAKEHELVKKFYDNRKVSVPILLDPQMKTAQDYEVSGIPCLYVIGRDGIVRKVYLGYGDKIDGQIRQEVQAALSEGR